MIFILADNNLELNAKLLWTTFTEKEWHELGVAGLLTMENVGLDPASNDRVVWTYCQERQFLLITANRNMKGDDSLEAVIQQLNRSDSLPVLTLAVPERVYEAAFREACAYRIADIVLDLHIYRGTARQFIP